MGSKPNHCGIRRLADDCTLLPCILQLADDWGAFCVVRMYTRTLQIPTVLHVLSARSKEGISRFLHRI